MRYLGQVLIMSNKISVCQKCKKLIGTESVCHHCGYKQSTINFSFNKSCTDLIFYWCIGIFLVTTAINLGMTHNIFNSLMTPNNLSLAILGLNTPLFFKGVFWGPVTATFLHIGIIHVAFNLYAIKAIGPFLEQIVGKSYYWIIFIISGVIGGILTVYMGNSAAGASGAIFGLIGAGMAITYKLGDGINDPIFRNFALWAGISFAIGIMSGLNLDNWGHFGGFVSGGFLGTIWLALRKNNIFVRSQLYIAALFLVLTIICYLTCFYFSYHQLIAK